MEGLTLHIERVRPASDCQMKMNSVPKEKITVASKSELTFQDCFPEDVHVTAMRVIGKSRWKCLAEASLGLGNKPGFILLNLHTLLDLEPENHVDPKSSCFGMGVNWPAGVEIAVRHGENVM